MEKSERALGRVECSVTLRGVFGSVFRISYRAVNSALDLIDFACVLQPFVAGDMARNFFDFAFALFRSTFYMFVIHESPRLN